MSDNLVRIVSDGRSRTQVFIGEQDVADHVTAIQWRHDSRGNSWARAVIEFADAEVDVIGEMPAKAEPLIDPDCRAGKHGSCVGGLCECPHHSCDLCGVASDLIALGRQHDIADPPCQCPKPCGVEHCFAPGQA